MASIAEWIEKIKTAIYGEEVRGAIWQSLDAMNTQVDAINVDSAQIGQNKQNIATNTAAITALNSRLVGLCSRWENYASSLSVALTGNGNRTGILVLSNPSSTGCALACYMVGVRIATGVASVEKISGTFDATVTATVTTSGQLTLTASKSCNMAFIYTT